MNDFLKSLSSPFTERVKSPIVGPFLVTWSVINWKIIYTTIFLSNDVLKPLNKLDYIYGMIEWLHCFWIPLLITAAYIFIMPYVDRMVMKFTESQKKKNLDLKFEIGRKFSVDGNKYYDLKEKFDKQREEIVKYEDKILGLNTKIVDMQNDLDGRKNGYENGQALLRHTEEKLQKLYKRDEIRTFFKGRWFSSVNGKYMEEIEFSDDNKYIIIEKDSQKRHAFNLVGVDIDIDRKKICFTKSEVKNNQAVCYNQLEIISDDYLEGLENGISIRYEKRRLQGESIALNE